MKLIDEIMLNQVQFSNMAHFFFSLSLCLSLPLWLIANMPWNVQMHSYAFVPQELQVAFGHKLGTS